MDQYIILGKLPPCISKSNYNFKCCGGCQKPIKRGQLITYVVESTGMELRAVVKDDGFYIKFTGRRIVHKDCSIFGIWTDYEGECETETNNSSITYVV